MDSRGPPYPNQRQRGSLVFPPQDTYLIPARPPRLLCGVESGPERCCQWAHGQTFRFAVALFPVILTTFLHLSTLVRRC